MYRLLSYQKKNSSEEKKKKMCLIKNVFVDTIFICYCYTDMKLIKVIFYFVE